MDKQQFFSQFRFRPELRRFVGVEREYFLVDANGVPVPRSKEFLHAVRNPEWTFELSACQVEHRTKPRSDLGQMESDLFMAQAFAQSTARTKLGCRLVALEVAPADMPLDVYPDKPRYAKIAATLPIATLLAACRVTGTHIHVGMSSMEEAVAFRDRMIPHIDRFAHMGDHTCGERLRLYHTVAGNEEPKPYGSAEAFYADAAARGFADNPRNCWDLVRISAHGTVELRMFGMTADTSEIRHWVETVLAYF